MLEIDAHLHNVVHFYRRRCPPNCEVDGPALVRETDTAVVQVLRKSSLASLVLGGAPGMMCASVLMCAYMRGVFSDEVVVLLLGDTHLRVLGCKRPEDP